MSVLEAPRENLVRSLDKLLGGELPTGAFIQWFNSVEWDDLIASDSESDRAVWDIQNILYQTASRVEAMMDDDSFQSEIRCIYP